MKTAIVNRSKRLTEREIKAAIAACQLQLATHVCPSWCVGAGAVYLVASGTKPLMGESVLLILDDPDIDGAGGYHSEDDGVIDGKVFVSPYLDNGGTRLGIANHPEVPSWSQALSHELIEQLLNPNVNRWAVGPQTPQGALYAFEACDPVQGVGYFVEVSDPDDEHAVLSVLVSDFVLPAYFDQQAMSQLAWVQALPGPFGIAPGGYQTISPDGISGTQVFGSRVPSWMGRLKLRSHRTQRLLSKPALQRRGL